MNTNSTYRNVQHATPNMEHRFQYDLALLAGGSATVSVQQLVGSSYQNLPSSQTQTATGTYTLAFEPTEETIRIVVASTNRFALTNLALDRDHVDTLVENYALHAGGYRYGFNGMEKDDEVKGRGNSYDFGARMYDSRLGRWLSVDPLGSSYPGMSPYNFCNNNPLIFNDPTGKSAELTIVKNPDGSEKAVISAHIVFYSGDKTLDGKVDHKRIVTEMMQQFNEGNGSITIDGKTYPVELSLTSEFIYNEAFNNIDYSGGNENNAVTSTAAMLELRSNKVADQKDPKNNYYRIERSGVDVSFGVISSQRAFILFRQTGIGSKTPLHEFLHTLGLNHPITFDEKSKQYVYDQDWNGEGPCPIMYPNGTKDNDGKVIDPSTRKISGSEINELSKHISIYNGTMYIGAPNNSNNNPNAHPNGVILLDKKGNGEHIDYEKDNKQAGG